MFYYRHTKLFKENKGLYDYANLFHVHVYSKFDLNFTPARERLSTTSHTMSFLQANTVAIKRVRITINYFLVTKRYQELKQAFIYMYRRNTFMFSHYESNQIQNHYMY